MKSTRFFVVSFIPCMLVGTALAACGTSEPRRTQAIERDSAGVRIVENVGSAAPAVWRVGQGPSVEIGVEGGDSMQLLHEVRGAIAVGEDEIVIANGSSPILRWFDRAGRFLRSTGRTGSGPGEFQGAGRISALWPVGQDSVATWEHPLRRMQVFGPEGDYVRNVILALPTDMNPGAYPQIVGRLGNEGFVAYLSIYDEPRNTGGTWRDSMTYVRWLADGAFADTVALLPGIELHNSEFMGRRSRGRVPLGKPMAAWADATGFYYGSGEQYEILAYRPSGELRMIIRRDGPLRAISDEDAEAYIDEQMRGAPPEPDVRRAWESTLRAAPFPDSLPAYRRIRTDRSGNLWVQDYDLPSELEVDWHVFDSRGAWLAMVRLPKRWQIQDIGRDYVLVLTTNEMDVQIIQLFGLDRSHVESN